MRFFARLEPRAPRNKYIGSFNALFCAGQVIFPAIGSSELASQAFLTYFYWLTHD
jgi:hypothetical protein